MRGQRLECIHFGGADDAGFENELTTPGVRGGREPTAIPVFRGRAGDRPAVARGEGSMLKTIGGRKTFLRAALAMSAAVVLSQSGCATSVTPPPGFEPDGNEAGSADAAYDASIDDSSLGD